MPELAWQVRAQGGYVDRDTPGPTARPSGPCSWFTDADGVCGQPSVARYLVGPRCSTHTPAALAGRPEPRPPAPVATTAQTTDPARYGWAKDSPRFRADGVTPWPRETKREAA